MLDRSPLASARTRTEVRDLIVHEKDPSADTATFVVRGATLDCRPRITRILTWDEETPVARPRTVMAACSTPVPRRASMMMAGSPRGVVSSTTIMGTLIAKTPPPGTPPTTCMTPEPEETLKRARLARVVRRLHIFGAVLT
jgi:hypothetical protein